MEEQVSKWLHDIGLSYAVSKFELAGVVSASALAELELAAIPALGIDSYEDRHKLFSLVLRIKKSLLSSLLHGIGLSYAVSRFKEAGYVLETDLADLEVTDFTELGVHSSGDRRKLFRLVQRIKHEVSEGKGSHQGKEGDSAILAAPRAAAAAPKFPNSVNIKAALDRHFEVDLKKIEQLPEDGTLYSVDDAFGTLATYWQRKIRAERFEPTEAVPARAGQKITGLEEDASMDPNSLPPPEVQKRVRVLYRADITAHLFEQVVDEDRQNIGLAVFGPQGIGKSHTLVNLVLQLQASRKYLVTFIPDCHQWDSADDLLAAICGSIGIEQGPDGIGLPVPEPNAEWASETALNRVINAITSELQANDRKWVFIFDQVNGLFRGNAVNRPSRIADLTFPFSMIIKVVREGVISVISASSNNEISLANEERFVRYNHATNMTDKELNAVFFNVAEGELQNVLDPIKELAGAVPEYVKKYKEYGDSTGFMQYIVGEVDDSVQALRDKGKGTRKTVWQAQLNSMISCVLGLAISTHSHDRKYLIPNGERYPGSYIYEPLFPAVVDAYRTVLFNEIMAAVAANEEKYLSICTDPNKTSDVKDRLFEFLVIRRIAKDGFEISDLLKFGPREFKVIPGQSLDPWSAEKTGYWVPKNSNFPAVDLWVQSESLMVAFQVHVSSHKDSAIKFFKMCESIRWFAPKRQVVLIYLSPHGKAKKAVEKLTGWFSPIAESGSPSTASPPPEKNEETASSKQTAKAKGSSLSSEERGGSSPSSASLHVKKKEKVVNAQNQANKTKERAYAESHPREQPERLAKKTATTDSNIATRRVAGATLTPQKNWKLELYKGRMLVLAYTAEEIGLKGLTWTSP
jgi:SAM domain (Sterile alpha motif)